MYGSTRMSKNNAAEYMRHIKRHLNNTMLRNTIDKIHNPRRQHRQKVVL